jgi:hypothetical protein
MTATVTPEPGPLVRHPQRPWRPMESQREQPRRLAEHRFAAPVVRELPPRRELQAALATW